MANYTGCNPQVIGDERDGTITIMAARIAELEAERDHLRAALGLAWVAVPEDAPGSHDLHEKIKAAMAHGTMDVVRMDVVREGVMMAARLARDSERLGSEFEKVWDDNVERLYETDKPEK